MSPAEREDPDVEMLSLRDLCAHLCVEDERTALAVAARFGLAPRTRFQPKDHYRFMWDSVLRFIHGIEPLSHRDISDELKQPLLHFADIAALFGKTSEALRKDVSRGKVNLPPAIRLTDRTRGWRPRDIAAWIAGHPLPVYAAFALASSAVGDQQMDPTAAGFSDAVEPEVTEPTSPSASPFDDLLARNRAIKLARQTLNTAPISTAA